MVLRHELFELLQYAPTTPQVHRRPLVMSPPQVNKFYAVDLTPDKSLVKWAVDSGVQMFVISWRNPTVEQRHWGLEHYVKAIDAAVDAARQITGSPDVNLWGSCSGGMAAAAYLRLAGGPGRTQGRGRDLGGVHPRHERGAGGFDAGTVQLAVHDPQPPRRARAARASSAAKRWRRCSPGCGRTT